jgi:hypothetical protein
MVEDLESYVQDNATIPSRTDDTFDQDWIAHLNSKEHQEYLAKLSDGDPIYILAKHLNCDPEIVNLAMQDYPMPDEQTPEAFELYKTTVANDLRLAKAASSLASALAHLDDSERRIILKHDGLSTEQLKNFATKRYAEADSLQNDINGMRRNGGKRRDAIIVASIVHETFLATGREISAQHVSGAPVSEFGQTVVFALKLWGIKADWRRASEAVVRGERVCI